MAAVVQLLALAVFVFVAGVARAQIAGTGNIQGTVSDATGAAIANASVTLTDETTKIAQTTKTDSAGVYVFPNIKVGTYTVQVAAPSFQTFTQTGNVLDVGSSISVNVKMTVGAATEHVEVHTDSLALQTEDPTFKQTINSSTVLEMPLNGRQMTALIQASGGSTNASGGDFSNGSKYSYASVSISVAGGQGNTILYRLDGADNNDYMGNTNLPFPFPDAVDQFSVETAALGAQDGMHSGGMVNVVTRSGTNRYHGSAFEFIRNNYIDATNFFVIPPNGPGSGKDQLHQNEYGGTFGGPIKHDKLFAFAGYQFHEAKQLSATTTAHVPTAANLAGDFSVTAPPPGSTITKTSCTTSTTQLLDPLTGAVLPGNKYNQPGGPALPTWNAQSLALLKYLPPINPNVDIYNCGVVQYATPNDVYDKQFVTREDYIINSRNNLFARYMFDGYQLPSWFFPNNILVTAAAGNPLQRVQSLIVGENFTASSNLVNSAHVAVLRRVNNRGYNASDINAPKGLGVAIYNPIANGLQLSTGGGVGGFTIGGGTNSVAHFNDNTLAIDDEVTLVHGHHQFVFGGEFVRNQLNIGNGYESNGQFSFNSAYSSYGPYGNSGTATQNPNYKTTQIGDGALDFLEGTMSAFQQSKQQQNALRAPIPSLYFQDTYHATPQLTIVAGLRWSPEFEPTDYFNRGVVFNNANFLSTTYSKVFSGGFSASTPGTTPNGAPAGALFYGDAGVPKAFTQNSPWQFDPNLGFAYDVSGKGKTVIRAGAEYIYDEPNFFTGQRNQQNPPFATAISQNSAGYIPFSTPWSIPSALVTATTINTNPFPQAQIAVPGQVHFFPNSQYIVLPAHFRPSSTMQWTASIQQSFGKGWQFQLDYIGNKTSHIELGIPLNPVVYIPGNWNGPGSCVAPGTNLAEAGTGTGACSQANGNSYQARALLTLENPTQGAGYSFGGGGSVLIGDEGMANYHGLITSINRRLSSTFTLLGNWTWSKCLDIVDEQGDVAATSVQNFNNPASDYGPCGFDYRHIENVSLVARTNFSLANRWEKVAVNGWEIAPLIRIQTGAPFSVTLGTGTANDNSLVDVNNDHANLVPGQPIYQKVAFRQQSGAANREYLNPAAFTKAPVGTFGTTGRNAFRGTPAFNMDAQISRIFELHESLNMQLRLEAFNVLNHPNFSNPTATISSGTFGQVGSTTNNARVFQGAVKFSF
ncbi:MAG TPA: carboxypeptidase-like regulatory domain-containing protein [Acidobacteriaceae bacterium]|nr:carboxypeptidase-like regulatory domain-containing protein [Acidobacteriaceae bacterium]